MACSSCRFFPKALRRVLPENPLNTYTSTLTLTHLHFDTHTDTHTHTLEERKHPSAKYTRAKASKCEVLPGSKYASVSMQACNDYARASVSMVNMEN